MTRSMSDDRLVGGHKNEVLAPSETVGVDPE
jgi:hypothetical protein